MEKDWRALLEWFAGLDLPAGSVVAVAWSGGVDSTLVAAAGREALGDDVIALTADTPLLPAWERAGLAEHAASLGFVWSLVPVDVLEVPAVQANHADRCYHCKRFLLEELLLAAGHEPDSPVLLVDGTNAGDDPGRPGRKALEELGVRSPLEELGMDKERVRRLAAARGMAVADRPSESCLATRITGPLTLAALEGVETLERVVRGCGIWTCRVRLDELAISIETLKKDKHLIDENRDVIMTAISRLGWTGFTWSERLEEGP